MFNSLTKTIENIQADNNKCIAVYACGPTTYAPTHLGHARTYVWMDIIRRILEQNTQSPLFVMNITDVDEKIFKAAEETGIAPHLLARKYEAEFWEDMDSLNCLRPHIVTRVSEHIHSDIIPFIEKLANNRMIYEIDDPEVGGVYFDVKAFEKLTRKSTRYGKLAPVDNVKELFGDDLGNATGTSEHIDNPNDNNSISDEMNNFTDCTVVGNLNPLFDNKLDDVVKVSEHPAVVHSDSEGLKLNLTMKERFYLISKKKPIIKDLSKRDPRDFALWKLRKPEDTTYWESPWGEGYPGWHIECSSMIQSVQNQLAATHSFTIHVGGVDLKFPHHTNEIALAEAFHLKPEATREKETGEPSKEWIRHWVHTGNLHINGLKMSKSLKNFITVKEALKVEESVGAYSSPADDFRLWVLGLSGSYRDNASFTEESFKDAKNIREKIVRFLLRGQEWLLRRQEKAGLEHTAGVKKWREHECELFDIANAAAMNSKPTLLSDLDGSKYVKELVRITDAGISFLDQSESGTAPEEPVAHALRVLRELLEIPGFSETTTRAGLNPEDAYSNLGFASTAAAGYNIIGGRRALLDAITRFRSNVRRTALAALADSEYQHSDGLEKILKICDGARDVTFANLGLEFVDYEGDDMEGVRDDWRFTTRPQKLVYAEALQRDHEFDPKDNNTAGVSIRELFKRGKYRGRFSVYDENGFPLKMADGSDVSRKLHQKLEEKLRRHKRILEKVVIKRKRRNDKKRIAYEKMDMTMRMKKAIKERKAKMTPEELEAWRQEQVPWPQHLRTR
jgi:cysteinyl-tRNA synthetase